MRKSYLSTSGFVLILALLILLVRCKKENADALLPAKDFSKFNTFDRLLIGSGFRTTVRQGPTRQVIVSVPASDEANLAVGQDAGTLIIDIRNKSSQLSGIVEITMPVLNSVNITRGATATISGFTAIYLRVEQSGGSTTSLSGSYQNLSLRLIEGSRFNGYDAVTTNAGVNLSEGSEARITVLNNLGIEATGGSRLFYKGTPTLTQNLSGNSTVTRE